MVVLAATGAALYARHQVRGTSIHPMFGPSTVLLRGADVVICETGDSDAAIDHISKGFPLRTEIPCG